MPAGDGRSTARFALHISTTLRRPGRSTPARADAGGRRLHPTRRSAAAAATPRRRTETSTRSRSPREIVLALQAMVTRRVDVFDPAVVTIAHIDAGTTNNIIPETARPRGHDPDAVARRPGPLVHDGVRRVVEGICAAHGATAELEIDARLPGHGQRPGVHGVRGRASRPRCWAPTRVIEMPARSWAPRTSRYVLQRVPGAMFFLGARPPEEDPATAPPEPLQPGGVRRAGDGGRAPRSTRRWRSDTWRADARPLGPRRLRSWRKVASG